MSAESLIFTLVAGGVVAVLNGLALWIIRSWLQNVGGRIDGLGEDQRKMMRQLHECEVVNVRTFATKESVGKLYGKVDDHEARIKVLEDRGDRGGRA